jgi:cholesterol transport system auxiliary component
MKFFIGCATLLIISACSPIKTPVTHQYKLEAFSQAISKHTFDHSILISQPEAMAGYQTEQMLYIQKPYQLSAFSENAWVGTPANMLYPLLIQSLQHSHAFKAVASSPFADRVDYRLDTQILAMEQNFLNKPSVFVMSLKAVLTRVKNNQVLASRIISVRVPCPMDTPYGGVIAANKASVIVTEKIKHFVTHNMLTD